MLDVIRCGICGSDLHARQHADALQAVTAECGYDGVMRRRDRVVLGHEFSGTVTARGRGTRTPEGTDVVAFPLLRRAGAVHPTGLSPHAAGGYAEKVLVEESLTLPVPNGFSPRLAALTEPMAVGLHAVRRGRVRKGDVAVVVGCGPVGLAVIAMLKARGVRRVVATDLSAARRELARTMGADVVVDPAVDSPYEAAGAKHLHAAPEVFELALGAMERFHRLRLPWWHLWRAADLVGAVDPPRPVVFECVGVPGMIDRIVTEAPFFSRVVVVGVCMEADAFRPAIAINKELDLRFVIGYTPLDFRDSLHLLAEGAVDPAPLVTGEVGLAGVADAFEALSRPERHAKILVDPASTAGVPAP